MHDALVILAIEAGSARRAYLKGMGEAIGCHPPNAPRHLALAAPPVSDTHRRPVYPIH